MIGIGPLFFYYRIIGVDMFKPVKSLRNSYLKTAFIGIISIISILIAYYLILDYVKTSNFLVDDFHEIRDLIVLLLIMSLCRSLPLPTRMSPAGFDISTISIFSVFLIKGPGATMLLIILSSFFTFVKWDSKKVSHIFNTELSKTLYNNASRVIPVFFGWLAYRVLYHQTEPMVLPDSLLPSIVFLLIFLLVNSIMLAALFRVIARMPFFKTCVNGFMSMFPTLMALAPIGFFLSLFMNSGSYGSYTALLFFIPMLFARYAFKLYLDSKEQYIKTIITLTAAIEAKDKYTEGHSKRVEEYAVQIAQQMKMQGNRIDNIKVAAVLHDIGKIGIDDEILRKPSKLNDEEWSRIMQHPSIGIRILEEVEMPQAVRDMIQYHHVRYDLKGYPLSDKYKEIPMEVHIISLADAYDAMTSNRPYRPALAEEVALQNILDGKGTQFHPAVVDAFFKMKKRG